MRQIREILLTQYIGAIAIGFIFAQTVIQFVNMLTLTAARYWVAKQSRESALVSTGLFDWSSFIVSVASIAMNLLAGFFLIRWLYAEDETPGGEQEAEVPSAKLEQ